MVSRDEIDTLMAKYVGQEHTMYLKVCSLAAAETPSTVVTVAYRPFRSGVEI